MLYIIAEFCEVRPATKRSANIQVVGFSDTDTYDEVLAKGLGVKCDKSRLALICSNGIDDLPWTLGE